MSFTMREAQVRATRLQPVGVALTAMLVAAALLSGCGERKDRAANQTAVKVNKDEITVQQINFMLQQQRGLRPDQADAASRQILERLIDQQLALQKADDLKLDRDPRVVQQFEAARREILARAYFEKVGESAPKPTPEEIKKYYDDKPALFRERRIYSIQEVAIEAKPEQVDELREKLGASKNIADFIDFLKSRDYRFSANQAVRAAEQLPLNSLDALARMKDGQAMVVPAAGGVQVVLLANSRSQPVSEEQARPAIEQYLINERKRKLAEDDLKTMRAAARIEYFGSFAPSAATAASAAPTGPAPAPSGATSPTATDFSKGLGLK